MAKKSTFPAEKRQKWSVLNVTAAERDCISAAAVAQGLPVNRYILEALATRQLVARSDWRELVRLLAEVSEQLAGISDAVRDRALPLDAVRIDLGLLAIERLLLREAMPWLDREAPEDAHAEATDMTS